MTTSSNDSHNKISLLDWALIRSQITDREKTSNNASLQNTPEIFFFKYDPRAGNNKHDNSGDCQCRIQVSAHQREGRNVPANERSFGQDHTKNEAVNLNQPGAAERVSNNMIKDDNNSMNEVISALMNLIDSHEGFIIREVLKSSTKCERQFKKWILMKWQKKAIASIL